MKPKKERKKKWLMRLKLTAQINNEAGMDQFARLLRVLYDNGFEPTVKAIRGPSSGRGQAPRRGCAWRDR